MNIALIGYRGCGKSAVGRLLAKLRNMTLVSLDEEIEKNAGLSIPQIVEQSGWDHFRNLEQAATAAACSKDNTIIDTGGGVITRQANVDLLRAKSTVFWLTAKVDTIVQRISGSTNRPALVEGKTFIEEISQVLTTRHPLYEKCAHHVISTDGRTPTEIATSIISRLP